MQKDMEMNEKQLEIKRHIDKLDQFVIGIEATWGIGNLYDYAPEDLKMKFNRQQYKLSEAIKEHDLNLVALLVDGMIRGWAALEKAAMNNGYEPITPWCMEIKLESGFHLRIAKNETEARQCTDKGVYVWSLPEIARVIEKDYTLVNAVKETFPGAAVNNVADFDFKKGDDFPF